MTMRLVCAWCLTEITPGDENEPTSHGICQKCNDEVFAEYHETPSTKLAEDATMIMLKTKVFFGMRDDKTLLVVGACNSKLNYAGDYYANEFYDLPDNFNPVGLTLAQLTNYLKAWNSERTLESDLQEDR